MHARAFGHPVPQSGYETRRQAALPSSRVPPLKTCPALRPRWCPAHSPKRTQDCCLPATGNRRLPTTIPISGLHHAACLLATPGFVRPLTGRHAGSLLTCWLGFDQVGLEPYGLAPTGKRQPISWACAQFQGCGLTLARPLPGSVAVGQGWDRGCGFPKALQEPLTRTRRCALWPLPGVDSLPARR